MAEKISYAAGIAKAKLTLGSIVFHAGEFQSTIQYVLPSIALLRELGHSFDLASALNRLAGALAGIHDYAAAQQAHEECRDIYQSLGYRRGVATTLQNLGGEAFDQGDYTRARALLCEALRIRGELGLPRRYAYSFEFIADLDEAEKLLNSKVEIEQQIQGKKHRQVEIRSENDRFKIEMGGGVGVRSQERNIRCPFPLG